MYVYIANVHFYEHIQHVYTNIYNTYTRRLYVHVGVDEVAHHAGEDLDGGHGLEAGARHLKTHIYTYFFS